MKYLFFFVTLAFATGCGTTTHIEKSWRDPDVTVDMDKLHKVVVVAMLKNETTRRATEDKLAAMLNGKGVPSYTYLTQDIRQEKEQEIANKFKNEGVDGVVIMHLADVDKDVKYVPGNYSTFPPYYRRFWGYYWNNWNSYYQPGYYETTKKYTVETNVYSLTRDKLIWSGLTTSVDPENVESLMSSVAETVYKQMKKEQFLVN